MLMWQTDYTTSTLTVDVTSIIILKIILRQHFQLKKKSTLDKTIKI